MDINELLTYNLSDAVKFNDQLNSRIWDANEQMRPEVRESLLAIAQDFEEFLGITQVEVQDITVSGSNAAYTYTDHSDIDLHLVVDLPKADESEVYRELFDAKKYQYNDLHNIKIGGYDVELYVQNANQPHHSRGIYSVLNDQWISVPSRRRPDVNDESVRSKYEDLAARIEQALKTSDHDQLAQLMSKIKRMRQAGLDQAGEFGAENLAFKMLRTQGYIERLAKARNAARDQQLSLDERRKKKSKKKSVRYAYGGYWYPGTAYAGQDHAAGAEGGGGESIQESAEQQKTIINRFANSCAELLKLSDSPQIVLHNNTKWSEQNGTFGRYTAEPINTIELATSGRHIIDILRTLAHEMTHAHQNETTGLPDNAGETGSPFEDQANAMAGRIMRHWATQEPEMFAGVNLEESSGYIPTTKQKNDPRFKTALTVDVRPGQTGREANKMGLQTDAQGKPALLIKSLKNALREFKETGQLVNEQDFLGEIKMTGKNLRAEAAKTGAQAGMEFEMIVPNTEVDIEPEYEPDWDQDQRTRSFRDIRDFFHDGDNGRRAVDDLMDEINSEYSEWKQEQISDSWDSEGLDYLRDYIANNDSFDRDEALDAARDEITDANPDLPPESEEFSQLLSARLDEMEQEFVEQEFNNKGSIYDEAFDEFTDEKQSEDNEEEFLDEKYPNMTDIQSNFDINWPYYHDINDGQSDGEMDIDQVADEFGSYMGKPVNASRQYHGGRREAGTYVVEPDGSLEGDNPGDGGLEFVSPPMPIDEMIADLNKVKAWADKTGCYTNDSTGLHINISVPDYSIDKLDYVKLAILMGDEYVLELFGRSGNTYAKSAMGKIKSALKQKPDAAAQIMDLMKQGLDGAATKAIHTGITDKYTSINTKTGYIEFRSPGGDWLDSNFANIENTLLRFTVALSAAINPEAYRKEYLTKLYKLLSEGMDKSDVDVIQLFANYSAGELDKPALIRQVRQKQLARNVAKGKATGKMWWSVSRPGYMASIEVVADNAEEAIASAILPGNYPDWASARNTLQAKPVRPYVPYEVPTAKAAEPAADNQGNWGIWIGASQRFARQPNTIVADNVLRRFPSQAAAMAFLERTQEENPQMRTDVEVREIPSDDTPADTPAAQPVNRNTLMPTGPGPWEVFRISDGSSVAELGQTNRMSAEVEARRVIDQRREAPELYGVRTRQAVGSAQRSSYELYSKTDGRAVTAPAGNPIVFQATDPDDAANKIARYVADFNLPGHPTDYDVRSVLQPAQQDAAQGGVVDVAGEQPAQAPNTLTRPGQGQQQFTGTWRVLDPEDREIYRFSGVGNNQSDANRVAINWLRQNPGRMQAGVTVVPEMA